MVIGTGKPKCVQVAAIEITRGFQVYLFRNLLRGDGGFILQTTWGSHVIIDF